MAAQKEASGGSAPAAAGDKKQDKSHGGGEHQSGGGGHKKGGGHGEEVNLERWLVSYADFMTLCFCLFVVLYAISIADAKKMQSFAKGMMDKMEGRPSGSPDSSKDEGNGLLSGQANIMDNVGREIIADLEVKRLSNSEMPMVDLMSLADYIDMILRKTLGEEKANQISTVVVKGVMVKVTFPDTVLYQTGSSEIADDMKNTLKELGNLIATQHLIVNIEGVTVSDPDSSQSDRLLEQSNKKSLGVLTLIGKNPGIRLTQLTLSSKVNKQKEVIAGQLIKSTNSVNMIFYGDKEPGE